MSNERAQEDTSPLVGRHDLTLVCARCGGSAAEFALLPAGFAVEGDTFADRPRLRREGFMGTVTWMWSVKLLVGFFGALARGDFGAARDIDADGIGLYCPQCEAVYCERCWDIGPPVFDEELPGFYDCTYGTCPQGHRHIVDD